MQTRTLELPSNNIVPLVQLQGKIAMRLDLACEVRVHGGFGGRTNGNGLLEIRLSSLCDPSDFGGEALNVLLLPLKIVLADEDGEVRVADLQGFDLAVEPGLDGLPDGVRCGFEDVADL